ncbi:Quercetin 2,3-dioxygenase [Streptomyces sp. YIM 130001]|uniref:pirin family protein n=1 Tax=Streptomyces sp. YIM 130001 TaxID=2259644 RepID=UPI000E659F39|nr:pirin family protein [Streptomyces sp. YIM 130001]RII20491.1 Quercetin 2,3-dioxygenase [Streptomyces sp. YIM 130001]
MSNLETHPRPEVLEQGEPCTAVEVLTPRPVPLGGVRATTVHRTLPQRRRSLVGSWCFLDHFGPDAVSETGGMRMPRHPHTGLATVSWLFAGHVDHLDSGGNSAPVVPGELNLMIAGRGITHQEISGPDVSTLHGVQLWYALPDEARFGENAFVHHVPEPVALPGVTARVFIGELLGSVSPVDTRTPDLLGAELVLEPGSEARLTVRADFEHAVLAENAAVTVNSAAVDHRSLAYVPPGSETLVITAGDTGARVILLGGVPLGEQIVMWWNFIGRSHDEIVEFRRRYQAELGFEPADPVDTGKPALFGEFPPGQLPPLPAPVLPNSRMRPRA